MWAAASQWFGCLRMVPAVHQRVACRPNLLPRCVLTVQPLCRPAGALDMREVMEFGEAVAGHQRSMSHAVSPADMAPSLFGGKACRAGGKELGGANGSGSWGSAGVSAAAACLPPWARAEAVAECPEVLYSAQRLYLNVSSMNPDKALLCQVPPPAPPPLGLFLHSQPAPLTRLPSVATHVPMRRAMAPTEWRHAGAAGSPYTHPSRVAGAGGEAAGLLHRH